eukprot:jgi/Picre1/29327/NNA_004717.t1
MPSKIFIGFFTIWLFADSAVKFARCEIAKNTGVQSCLMDKKDQGSLVVEMIFPGNLSLYPVARRTTSLLHSNWPVGIVYPKTEQDIREALACATEYETKVAARCGGHGNAGQAVLTGGLTLDLREMNAVSFVNDSMDLVRVQAGATAGSAVYWTYTLSNGTRSLPVGQKPSVGIAGLTLGGGFGFSTRHTGLLCDRLQSVRIILADGTAVNASKEENSDLFWSSCGGGGGNYGIVTEFVFRPSNVDSDYTEFVYLMPLVKEYATPVVDYYQDWSMVMDNRATANLEIGSVLESDVDEHFVEDIADWLSEFAEGVFNGTEEFLQDVPTSIAKQWRDEGQMKFLMIVGFFRGNETEFNKALRASGLTNSTPIQIQGFYTNQGTILDAVLDLSGWDTPNAESLLDRFEQEHTYYKYKSMFLEEKLSADVVDILIDHAYFNSSESVVFEFQSLGGSTSAFAAVSPTDTAFAHRNARHCLMFKSNGKSLEAGTNAMGRMWSLWNEILPSIKGGAAYVNHMDTDITQYEKAYYGLSGYGLSDENAQFVTINRLAGISAEYDPAGRFSSAQPCCTRV